MPIFGITASSNQTAKLSDFYQIATTTLGSAQANVTFSSIPQTYTHLQIRLLGRSSRVGTADDLFLNFNGDTSTNYVSHSLLGDGATVTSGANTGGSNIRTIRNAFTTSSNTASVFTVGIIDILDYTNTNKNTTVRTISGYDSNGSGVLGLTSGYWNNTAAITEIVLKEETGANLVQYTSMALYGIKG
jgi:hypothetical protein